MPQIQPGAAANDPRPPPYIVVPLRDVLRGVRVSPADWPEYDAASQANFKSLRDECLEAAACRGSKPVLVFFPPVSGTYWPVSAPPAGDADSGDEADD